jgi:hypothetical protein
MTQGPTDDLKTPHTQRLLPSYPVSVERDWHRIEIDKETAALNDACNTDYGDIGTDDASALPTPVPADAESAALDGVGMIERRFRQEGWTTRDLYAAFLQASLLSYQSSRDAEDQHGYRYINSKPSGYEHNCPWNDWTPPSKSIELFQAAAEATANKCDIVSRRVRVHLCREAAPESDTVIAFASIETNQEGTTCLLLRRGAEILASLPVARVSVAISCRGLPTMLSTTGATEAESSLWIKFETDANLTKFCGMLGLERQ